MHNCRNEKSSRVEQPSACRSTALPEFIVDYIGCLQEETMHHLCEDVFALQQKVGLNFEKTNTGLFLGTIQSSVMSWKALKDIDPSCLKDRSFPYEPAQGWRSSWEIFLSALPPSGTFSGGRMRRYSQYLFPNYGIPSWPPLCSHNSPVFLCLEHMRFSLCV